MTEKTCCFTGHRDLPMEDINQIAEQLEKVLVELIKKGYKYFCAGGALGFDTLAEQTVLNLKEKYPDIRLILVLPCVTQSKSWGKEDQAIYEKIKEEADKIVYTSEKYVRGCMHKRNRHLVDNSSMCVCYLTKPSGGTFYTVNYARKQGRPVINISDSEKF